MSERHKSEAERLFARFSAGRDSFSVKHAYGQSSTRGEIIREAKFLSSSVDLELKAQLEAKLKECRRNADLKRAEVDEVQSQLNETNSSIDRLKSSTVPLFNEGNFT